MSSLSSKFGIPRPQRPLLILKWENGVPDDLVLSFWPMSMPFPKRVKHAGTRVTLATVPWEPLDGISSNSLLKHAIKPCRRETNDSNTIPVLRGLSKMCYFAMPNRERQGRHSGIPTSHFQSGGARSGTTWIKGKTIASGNYWIPLCRKGNPNGLVYCVVDSLFVLTHTHYIYIPLLVSHAKTERY
jgi:hypothetical protein